MQQDMYCPTGSRGGERPISPSSRSLQTIEVNLSCAAPLAARLDSKTLEHATTTFIYHHTDDHDRYWYCLMWIDYLSSHLHHVTHKPRELLVKLDFFLVLSDLLFLNKGRAVGTLQMTNNG